MNVTTEYRKIRLYCDTMSNTNNNDKKKWNTMHEIYRSPKLSSISREEQKCLEIQLLVLQDCFFFFRNH